MAVAFDTSVVGGGNGVNSFTFAALTTAGGNELLVACVHYSNNTPTAVAMSGGSGITWTQMSTRIANGGSSANGWFEVWYAFAASTQSAVVFTATLTGGGFPQTCGVLAAFSGVDTNTTTGTSAIYFENSQTGTGANPSVTFTTRGSNALTCAVYGQTANNAFTAGTSQTNTATATSGGTVSTAVLARRTATTPVGSLVTMNETLSASNWSQFTFEVLPPGVLIVNHPNNRGLRPRLFAPGIAR